VENNVGYVLLVGREGLEKLQCSEEGEDLERRRGIFDDEYDQDQTSSKIVQINNSESYLIGGFATKTLLSRDYEVLKTCLRFNIKDGKLTLR